MKVLAFFLLVIGVSMVSSAPQGSIHHAILGVINSAVPVVNVQPGFGAGPQPGGVSAFAAATHQQGPQGSGFSAQTGVSGPSGRN